MAIYLRLAFQDNSAAQHPELLYREPALMTAVIGCAVLLWALVFIDIPELHRLFTPLNCGLPLKP